MSGHKPEFYLSKNVGNQLMKCGEERDQPTTLYCYLFLVSSHPYAAIVLKQKDTENHFSKKKKKKRNRQKEPSKPYDITGDLLKI